MRRLAFLIGVVLSAVVFISCAGTTAPAAPPAAATQPPAAQATQPPAAQATQPPAATQAPAAQATQAPAAASGSFTLYTSESEDKVNEMVNDFKQVNPGIDVNIYRSGTGEVTAKIQAEQQAGEIKADMIWFADYDFFQSMANQDLLLTYNPKNSDKLPDTYRYFDNRAFEVRLIFNVVAYNTNLVKTPPTSWKDLLDPQYKDKIAVASPFYSGAAFAQVGTFVNLPDFGWDFYQKLKDNGLKVEQGNGNVQSKLASGEYAMGQLVDFMARDSKTKGSPVDHIWPAEGALLVPTPIGILKNSKNAAAAEAFLDYMFTERAQNLFVKQGYISSIPGMPTPPNTPDLSKLKVLTIDNAYINAHRDEIRSKFADLFGGQ